MPDRPLVSRALDRLRPGSPAPASAPPSAPVEAASTPPATGSADAKLLRAYVRTARAVLGGDRLPKPDSPAAADVEFDPTLVEEVVGTARRDSALAEVTGRLSRGEPLDEAVVSGVRALTVAGERTAARGLVLTLDDQLGTRLTPLGLGLVLAIQGNLVQAWGFLREVPADDLARLVPVEAVASALAVASAESVAAARDLGGRGTAYDPATLAELAGRLLVTGHRDLADQLVREAHRRDLADTTDFVRESLDNLERWIDPPAAAATTGVALGVIDYDQPDYARSSRNVGDYVQTLAMLGNLARFQRVRYAGADDLGALMGELQGRVKPALLLEGPEVDATVLPVSRDYSGGQQLPQDVWTLVFGWHLHSNFRLNFALPYHPNVNPIFVAFHVNRDAALSPEALEWMREHGPVGCRDWTTVDTLLSAGVDAFFTGCLTSTVDAVFPETSDVEPDGRRRVGAVDVTLRQLRRIKGAAEVVTHGGDEHRLGGLATGVHAASDLLDSYQRRYSRIVTSRLHSYLPATSLGLPVRFLPPIPADVRFDGLSGMTPDSEPFTRMRDDLRDLLAGTFERVLDGAGRDEVYAHWREVTADRVRQARERLAAPTTLEAPDLDLEDIRRRVGEGTHHHGPAPAEGATDVAMSLDQNLAAMLPVVVESMVRNASGPLHLWVTTRGLGEAYRSWFSEQFPELPVTFLDLDTVDHGSIGRLIAHTTVATMDRLLLPELLPDLDRLVYLDIDIVVEGDVCELGAIDLGGHALAARTTFHSASHVWRFAGDILEPEDARELRRTLRARHPFDFTTFNAGVLVLDLERMRADRLVDLLPLWVGRFGLHDQDVLNAYVGADRADLPPRWNMLPTAEPVVDPAIVHYAGKGKPWRDEVAPEAGRWRRYARAFADRAAPMPDPGGTTSR